MGDDVIKLDDNYRVRSDKYQWILEKRIVNEETFEESWRTDGFYPTLESVIRNGCNQALKSSKNIELLLKKIDELQETIKSQYLASDNDCEDDIDFLD